MSLFLGIIAIIFACISAFEAGKAGWNDEEINIPAEIVFPLFLIVAAICFK